MTYVSSEGFSQAYCGGVSKIRNPFLIASSAKPIELKHWLDRMDGGEVDHRRAVKEIYVSSIVGISSASGGVDPTEVTTHTATICLTSANTIPCKPSRAIDGGPAVIASRPIIEVPGKKSFRWRGRGRGRIGNDRAVEIQALQPGPAGGSIIVIKKVQTIDFIDIDSGGNQFSLGE